MIGNKKDLNTLIENLLNSSCFQQTNKVTFKIPLTDIFAKPETLFITVLNFKLYHNCMNN